MSKIIKLKVNNLFNLNYNSNTFIYPKTFFDKVYTSNSIRNNTIKYDFNLFNNRIQSIQETVNHIKNNTIYFQENNEKLLDIIDREKKALNTIEANIAQINNLKIISYKDTLVINYYSATQKPSLEDFKLIKEALNQSKEKYLVNWFYQRIIPFLIEENFITRYIENEVTYYKMPIIPFVLKYNNYFLNLILNVNSSTVNYFKNRNDLQPYNPSFEISNDNRYKNIEYALLFESDLTNSQFLQNVKNFTLIGDNIPI